MKKVLGVLISLALISQPLYAASITVTASGLSAEETAALNWRLAQVNAQRASQNPPLAPFASVKAYYEDLLLNSILPSTVREYADQKEADQNLKTLWRNATQAKRDNAIAALQ